MSRSGHFKCANGAEVMARSLDAGITGHGFDLMVFDDPMDAGDAFNAAARAHVIDLFERKFSSRLQSQGQSKILIVAQRLHRDDLCGHLISQGGCGPPQPSVWFSIAIRLARLHRRHAQRQRDQRTEEVLPSCR